MTKFGDQTWINIIQTKGDWSSHVLTVVDNRFVYFFTHGIGYESEALRLLGEVQAGADPFQLKGVTRPVITGVDEITEIKVPAHNSQVDLFAVRDGKTIRIPFPVNGASAVEVARDLIGSTGIRLVEDKEKVEPHLAAVRPLLVAILPAVLWFQVWSVANKLANGIPLNIDKMPPKSQSTMQLTAQVAESLGINGVMAVGGALVLGFGGWIAYRIMKPPLRTVWKKSV